MDIENLIIKFAVFIGTVDVFENVVYGLQQPFIGQRHDRVNRSRFSTKASTFFPAVETLVHHVVQPRDIQCLEGQQEITQR